MKIFWMIPIVLLAGCGVHYSIPNFETDEVEKIVSSGRSPQKCFENLKEDADELKVKVRVTDLQHEATSGPIAWLYTNSFICTGKVIKSGQSERKAL